VKYYTVRFHRTTASPPSVISFDAGRDFTTQREAENHAARYLDTFPQRQCNAVVTRHETITTFHTMPILAEIAARKSEVTA